MKLEKVKVFGKYIFYYLPDDKYVGQRVALEKYEPYLTDLMLSKIKAGDVVLDIGANIGYDTVLFADKVGNNGKVIAIEPDSINFEILQKNIKENKLFNVVAVQAAMGSENKKMGIYESKENYGDHRMWGNGPSVPVFCRRLDDLLRELEFTKIDFIKMDVQGFEPLVIEGGKETIEKSKPIIFFEYWPWGAKNAGSEIKEMIEFFRKIYKKIFWVDEYIQIHFPASQKFLDKKYSDKNEDDYGNLWVKSEINFNDRLGQFKSFWIKKLVKRILGRPET
ncbi:MAG: FkbM family methyltransferase [Candidatus Shapirobacteria bacterium]|nr:FkbM family methyltransferase [Candidatus Shapirobacteria bacterium]